VTIDEPSLFEYVQDGEWPGFGPAIVGATTTDRPLDPICGKPVRWNRRRREWSLYCAGGHCSSPTRNCKHCGQTFKRDDGGTRYCSPDCRSAWNATTPVGPKVCPLDGNDHENKNRWDLCGTCFALIRGVNVRLSLHHVPSAFVVALIKDPMCPLGCGLNLLVPVTLEGQNRARIPLVVDHDHRCCCTGMSCGACVRGLLCLTCNIMVGAARDNSTVLRAGADYLDAYERDR
jgi:hypothetical protein